MSTPLRRSRAGRDGCPAGCGRTGQGADAAPVVRKVVYTFDESNAVWVKNLGRLTVQRDALPGGNYDDASVVVTTEEVDKSSGLLIRSAACHDQTVLGRNWRITDPPHAATTSTPDRIPSHHQQITVTKGGGRLDISITPA